MSAGRRMLVVFGVVGLVAGIAAAVSSEALMSMCGKHCWLNGLLYAFFGDHYGKLVLGAIWYGLGAWCVHYGVFGSRPR